MKKILLIVCTLSLLSTAAMAKPRKVPVAKKPVMEPGTMMITGMATSKIKSVAKEKALMDLEEKMMDVADICPNLITLSESSKTMLIGKPTTPQRKYLSKMSVKVACN